MAEERRRHARLWRPFDGNFGPPHGGTTPCRISDISLGGCFIETLLAPQPGEETVVTILIGDHTLSFHGTVQYVEAQMGFAVEFRSSPAGVLDELLRLMEALKAPTR